MVKYNKEFIINYLKNYYKINQISPKSRDNIHPFSRTTVKNKFGSWNQALIEANIPLNKNKPKELHCNNCNLLFKKQVGQIKKTNNDFCSHSCSATYHNTNKKLSEYTKNKISKRLILFNSKKIKLKKTCIICPNKVLNNKRKTCSKQCLKILKSK